MVLGAPAVLVGALKAFLLDAPAVLTGATTAVWVAATTAASMGALTAVSAVALTAGPWAAAGSPAAAGEAVQGVQGVCV